MKIVKPGIEIMEQDVSLGLEGALRHIERIGRVCYKSEDRITEDSYKKFVKMLEDKGHGAMLEHGTVYLTFNSNYSFWKWLNEVNFDLQSNKYSNCILNEASALITTNYRVLFESGIPLEEVLSFICTPTDHERRISVKFICDRGVSHEFVRNRGSLGNAFAQESTRFCNYGGKGVIYCLPSWVAEDEEFRFKTAMEVNEVQYLAALEKGWQPQQARGYLNHFLKTELIITAFMSDWKHFLSLRAAPSAHPSAQELAYMVKEEFEKRGYL